jgi:hypothetical protein
MTAPTDTTTGTGEAAGTSDATGTVLRLRADAYYVPVPNGVWIRTTDGSFTLNGKAVATWVERLAPLLDEGVVPARLLGALRPEQAGFVEQLLTLLEKRGVVRREAAADGFAPDLARLFPQQAAFLGHFAPRPAEAFDRVRRHRLAVAGPAGRADVLVTTLMEAGFGDVALLDSEPSAELRDLAADFERRGAPVRLSGPDGDLHGRTLIGVFDPGTDGEADARRFLDWAGALGGGAWAGLVSGQAMLLKGQVPGSGRACVRCAWRRLAHKAVALPHSDTLGHVPVSVAATVLAQELFQYAAGADDSVLGEGVVVDLTRLSVWRTDVDPDPDCPACSATRASGAPAPARRRTSAYPDAVFGARCFGPLFSCTPEELPQFPLTALRVRVNPPGRTAPTGALDGPVVVARSMVDARAEAALTAVEATLPAADEAAVVGVGRDHAEALARALLRWADRTPEDARAGGGMEPVRTEGTGTAPALAELAALADTDVAVGVTHLPSGLWRARADDGTGAVVRTGFDPDQAAERALTALLARRQLGPRPDGAPVVAAWPGPVPSRERAGEVASALGLTWREAVLPPLVAADLTATVLTGGSTG